MGGQPTSVADDREYEAHDRYAGQGRRLTQLDIMWLIGIFVTWAVTRTPDYGPLPALIAQTSCE